MTVWVRAVQLVLLANAVPAFVILTSLVTGGAAHWILFAALLAGLVVAGVSGLRARVPAARATEPASSR